jgi:hypothetical protein
LSPEIADVLIDVATEAARLGAVDVNDGPAVTVEAAAKMIGTGRTKVFALLNEGRLKGAPKAGQRRMVLRTSIEAYLGKGGDA